MIHETRFAKISVKLIFQITGNLIFTPYETRQHRLLICFQPLKNKLQRIFFVIYFNSISGLRTINTDAQRIHRVEFIIWKYHSLPYGIFFSHLGSEEKINPTLKTLSIDGRGTGRGQRTKTGRKVGHEEENDIRRLTVARVHSSKWLVIKPRSILAEFQSR